MNRPSYKTFLGISFTMHFFTKFILLALMLLCCPVSNLQSTKYTVVCDQGWKYQLVIDNRYYILCFSVIDYRRCYAFNFFIDYRLFYAFCVHIIDR